MLRCDPQCLVDLGWPKILEALASEVSSDVGSEAIFGVQLSSDTKNVAEAYLAVTSFRRLLAVDAMLPLDGIADIRPALSLATRGGVVAEADLLLVSTTAQAIHRTKRHLAHHAEAAPQLGLRGEALPDLELLAGELAGTFDEHGRVRDDASPELAAARRRLISLHVQAKSRLEAFVGRADLQDWLQEPIYTLREDRYVVPVISSYQSQIPGIIHGTSNTGQSVYLEPTEFIEINNAIKVASAAAELELVRVLRVRTEWVAGDADDLRTALAHVAELDGLQARARFAERWDLHNPTLSPNGELNLKAARNPLLMLKGSDVIPNNVSLHPDLAFVIITGPNTGGKTVTLNTVGACALMAAAAIPLPVAEGSTLPLFDSLSALIGDPQDIDRDLSTFSGHLTELQAVMDLAKPNSLVLLDEIIVGTEPTQGAALAMASLEALASKGARGFVTTHYERLKTLPFEDPRFANASVGLDPDTLTPNYVLTDGEPGASNPFEIAARLGMSPKILRRARELTGAHSGLQAALDRLAGARAEAELAQREAERVSQEHERERHRLAEVRQRLETQAKAEVRALYHDARAALESAMKTMRERVAAVQRTNSARDLADARSELIELEAAMDRRVPSDLRSEATPSKAKTSSRRHEVAPATEPHDAGDFQSAPPVPCEVWVRTFQKAGTLVELKNDRAVVVVGPLRTTLKLSELGLLGGARPTPPRPTRPAKSSAADNSRPYRADDDDPAVPPPRTDDITADLRGLGRDDVREIVEPLIDRGYCNSWDAIWIIHGHGTGALRDEVRDLIRRSSQVKMWRPGRRHEGGNGVTIVWLKRL